MGMNPAISNNKGKELVELPKETSSKSSMSSKKNRRRQRKSSPVQMLFNICKEVFANGGTGFIPDPNDVERLKSILDSLKAEDVGLNPHMPCFGLVKNGRSIITYQRLFECDNFSIGIFCLPPSGVLPLHNHPGMTVFSKILFGTMHIKSYDWADGPPCTVPTSDNGRPARLAKLQVNADFVAPCNTSILYPTVGGNMHCFTAVTSCAVLDVLGPPYSEPNEPNGRHCTYFREYPFNRFPVEGSPVPEDEKDGFAWLQEREKPRKLIIVGAPYSGPKIVVDC